MKRDQRELVSFLLHLRTDVPVVYLIGKGPLAQLVRADGS